MFANSCEDRPITIFFLKVTFSTFDGRGSLFWKRKNAVHISIAKEDFYWLYRMTTIWISINVRSAAGGELLGTVRQTEVLVGLSCNT